MEDVLICVKQSLQQHSFLMNFCHYLYACFPIFLSSKNDRSQKVDLKLNRKNPLLPATTGKHSFIEVVMQICQKPKSVL